MTGPDPSFMTSASWAGTANLLAALWLLLGSVLGLGGSILLAHGIVPSLAISRDVPAATARRVRPPLYAAALVFLGMALYGITLFIDRLSLISELFYRGAQ